ncbi:MAG: DUF1501 domain-containing protein [Saprospiraceae bacterium]|nr:DUF1501 domain-containing protein [Saprospiraceae bacterium]
MKRRNFLKLSSLASLSTIFPLSHLNARAFSPLLLQSCSGINERILVLVRLDGGNDGINTIVPIDQYATYASLRPTIRIPDSGTDAYVNLDSSLAIADQVGLNPILTGFKNLYDNGELTVIQGVMYDNQDRSHFKSTDLWMTGGDGSPANNKIDSGWVGRYLEESYQSVIGNPALYNTPLAVQLADKKPSLLYETHQHGHSGTNLSGQDIAGYYSVVSGIAGAPIANIPATDHGDMLDYIMNVERNANIYSQTISDAFNSGVNSSVVYPSFDLADQLKTVARLVNGGLMTKVFLVSLSGFDTHSNQIDATTGVSGGRHAELLDELSQSLEAFMNDIKALGMADKFLTATFSEFGRKVMENGSYGTDHGGVAPMFVMGTCLNGGVIGTNVDLAEATSANNYQITTKQYDYRSVYATILQDWLGADTAVVDTTLFDNNNPSTSYTSSKLSSLISDSYKVDPNCYINSFIASSTQVDSEEIQLSFYPVPARYFVNIEFGHSFSGKITMTNAKGQIVSQKIVKNTNSIYFRFGKIPSGIYILIFESGHKTTTRKLVVS